MADPHFLKGYHANDPRLFMDDPSPLYQSRAGWYHTTAIIMLFLFIAGCAMVAAGFISSPDPGHVPFISLVLVVVGGVMAFTCLMVGFTVEAVARQIDRMVKGPLLACWSYTEPEWEVIRAGMSPKHWKMGGSLMNNPVIGYASCAILIILPVLVIADRMSGVRVVPDLAGNFILVFCLLILGVMGVIYLEFWWYERSPLGSSRQVLIAPTSIIIGDSGDIFDSSSLVTTPLEKEDSLIGVPSKMPQYFGSGTILDRVTLEKGDPWILEFHLRGVANVEGVPIPPLFRTLKILVPHGEEGTAEQIRDFFTPGTEPDTRR